jgi:hypothetical protein
MPIILDGQPWVRSRRFHDGSRARSSGRCGKSVSDLVVFLDDAPLIRVSAFHQSSRTGTCVHFLSMSTGDSHLCATSPVLELPSEGMHPELFRLRIWGDFIGVFHHSRTHHLHILNWRTGRQYMVCYIPNIRVSRPYLPFTASIPFTDGFIHFFQ